MGRGLRSSLTSLWSTQASVVTMLVCVFLVADVARFVDARPKITKEAVSQWASDWQEVADWWKPTNEKDKWRAFEPQDVISTVRWWEEKMDDDLWQFKAEDVLVDDREDNEDVQQNKKDREITKDSSTDEKASAPGQVAENHVVPVEAFCKLDLECRAGRICVQGVCKCIPSSMCAGHHKPICGTDGMEYSSHCELHRTACVKQAHIRVDRSGHCFRKDIERKEKSWLMEQERLLHENKEEMTKDEPDSPDQESMPQSDQPVDIPSDTIYQYPEEDSKKPETALNEDSSETQKETVEKSVSGKMESNKACTWDEMIHFKDSLLMYFCKKFFEPNCQQEVTTDREYLTMLVFSFFDQNFDYFLTKDELDDKEKKESFPDNIIVNCHLRDLVSFADNTDIDGELSISEFTSAFKIIPTAPTQKKFEVIETLASAGNGLELKCGIEAKSVIWQRQGTQLTDDKNRLMVFDDGALFISKVGLQHIGNYTCMDADNQDNGQIHRIKVQTLPVVTVTPVVQTHHSGSDVELMCYAEGVPVPKTTWTFDKEPLPSTRHYTHYVNTGHLAIHNVQFDKDAGTYTCTSHNQAGTTEKSVSVNILPPGTVPAQDSKGDNGHFVVFDSSGITVYNPQICLQQHRVKGDFAKFKYIPDDLDGPLTLCKKGKQCQWGGAVKVGPQFIYASQPDQNRLVVMDAGNTWNPLQVIDTDKKPGRLWYVEHLDQVWVLCQNQDDSDSNKTILVIRDARQHIQHRSVHTRPVGNHFDLLQELFIAPPNDLQHEFDYGYVSHKGQSELFKLNLEDMKYTKAINLSTYGCIPTDVAFVPLGGHIIIQCVSDLHTLQLTMDYLTDTIRSVVSISGRPMVSPDSRHLVTVDKSTGKVTVMSISDEGVMEPTYEVITSATISDVAFIPANFHHGYDLVFTSADNDDVITMDLSADTVDKLTGSKYSKSFNMKNEFPVHRHIVSSSVMNHFLMTPSQSTLTIVDVTFKEVLCEFRDSMGSDVMLFVPSSYTS